LVGKNSTKKSWGGGGGRKEIKKYNHVAPNYFTFLAMSLKLLAVTIRSQYLFKFDLNQNR
jgi:hypothetical protein